MRCTAWRTAPCIRGYREFINQEGGYTPIDSVFEYRTSGELSGFYFYPDSSGIWTRLETYHENGQVHMTVEKRKHVPSKYKRMFRELKKANREYNLGTDLQSSLVDDSLALKVVYLKEYTESGKYRTEHQGMSGSGRRLFRTSSL